MPPTATNCRAALLAMLLLGVCLGAFLFSLKLIRDDLARLPPPGAATLLPVADRSAGANRLAARRL